MCVTLLTDRFLFLNDSSRLFGESLGLELADSALPGSASSLLPCKQQILRLQNKLQLKLYVN